MFFSTCCTGFVCKISGNDQYLSIEEVCKLQGHALGVRRCSDKKKLA